MAEPAQAPRRPSAREDLARVCADVARTKDGRYRAIFNAAFQMGWQVEAGRLCYEEAGDALFRAAIACGYVEKHKAARTITLVKLGLAKGEAGCQRWRSARRPVPSPTADKREPEA